MKLFIFSMYQAEHSSFTLPASVILSGSGVENKDYENIVHAAVAPIDEVSLKKEPNNDDAVASTSWEQHIVVKREESIDIKHEPLLSKDDSLSLHQVRFHFSE
jgi:hypothetical protein